MAVQRRGCRRSNSCVSGHPLAGVAPGEMDTMSCKFSIRDQLCQGTEPPCYFTTPSPLNRLQSSIPKNLAVLLSLL